MDIAAFFDLSAGKWSSIKSNHYMQTTQQQSGRSAIEMTPLEVSDAAVVELCNKQGLGTAVRAARVTWDGTLEGNAKGDKGSTLLVAVAESPTTGKLVRSIGNFGTSVLVCDYVAGEGEMTFVTAMEGKVTTERVWFESDNVRLRHTKIQAADGECTVAFCSEIRSLAAAK
jgi:CpeS-like protein